jgi:DNA-binding response OmpR family regulator
MNALFGKSILIVKDTQSVANLLSEVVTDAGCKVVGPADTSVGAIEAASGSHVDAALLDVSLDGEFSFPVAEYLLKRGVPFVLLTGYGSDDIPSHLRGCPILNKPMTVRQLVNAINNLLNE